MQRQARMTLRFREHTTIVEFTTEDEDLETELAQAVDRQDSFVIQGPLTYLDYSMSPPNATADFFIVDATKLLYATVTYGPTLKK